MGDRACVVIRGSGAGVTGVCFYTHWNGEKLADMVRSGLRLASPDRLADGNYCARIVFGAILDASYRDKGQALTDKTGFGISSADKPYEDEYNGPIIVDLDAKTIRSERRPDVPPMPLIKFMAGAQLARKRDE